MRRLTKIRNRQPRQSEDPQVQRLCIEGSSLVLQRCYDGDQGVQTIPKEEISSLEYQRSEGTRLQQMAYQVQESLFKLDTQAECVIDLLEPVFISKLITSHTCSHTRLSGRRFEEAADYQVCIVQSTAKAQRK